MKVLVTGGRSFGSGEAVRAVLNSILPHITTLVHGACKTGVDSIADYWAKENGVACVAYPVDWTRVGKLAGPLRNSLMLNNEKPDLVLVFPGGRGTRDCELKARRLGLNVELVATEYDANGRLLPVKEEE